MFAFQGFLNTLIPVFQYSNFFIYVFSDSLTMFLLFKISGIEVFKKPGTQTPLYIGKYLKNAPQESGNLKN